MHNLKEQPPHKDQLKIAAFYCFTPLEDETIVSLLDQLTNNAFKEQVRGTVLLAAEGINGTICGPSNGIAALLLKIQEALVEKTLEIKSSWTSTQAFRRFKARRKSEIVTMGVDGINPLLSVGVHVPPTEWNSYLSDPDTLVIDTRNNYEVAIGTFDGSLNPQTDSFRDFPKWVDKTLNLIVEEIHPKRIAMFCTGGIRCEKATSYLLKQGFQSVHHLQGGILKYLEEVPQQESRWNGECFVFDQRVALKHNLLPGSYRLCHACGMPLAPEEIEMPSYIPGVRCLNCEERYNDCDRSRFAERQRQIDNCSNNLHEQFTKSS